MNEFGLDRFTYTIKPPITERLSESRTYFADAPDDIRRAAWAEAMDRLAVAVFRRLFPNRSYTIRYIQDSRRIGHMIEAIVTAEITYYS